MSRAGRRSPELRDAPRPTTRPTASRSCFGRQESKPGQQEGDLRIANSQAPADLETRLAQLESQNRRLKRGGFALGALTLSVGLVSATSVVCKTVWAKRFVLRDANGKERLVLDAYRQDAPAISFHDAKGRQIAKLTVDGDGEEMLEVEGSDLGEKAYLRLGENGSPFLDFGRKQGPKEGYSTQ